MDTIRGKIILGDDTKNFPLVVTAPINEEGEIKVLLSIDHDCNIKITGTKEELCETLKHPANQYSLWVLKPIITLAVEILRLRELTGERIQQ